MPTQKVRITPYYYYINTNEIPGAGELSCKNMISSNVNEKITVAMATKKIVPITAKKYLNEMVWDFIGVYKIKIEHYMAAWRYEISVQVLKNISLVRCDHS